MSFLNRFRSPVERERRDRERAERDAEKVRQAEAGARRQAEERAAQDAAAVREILGPELADMNVDTPAEAKMAIKLARLRKKEIQAEKRAVSAELADQREAWRERQAGRISTVGLGRGTGGRIVRAGIQGKRRSERLQNASTVNAYSDAKQRIDYKIARIDRFIAELERIALLK